jgi:RNA polymerase sigma-70 factor (ECF subfamily)
MAYFRRRVRSHSEAEDLTQDVFLRLSQINGRAMQSAEAYIFRMAANLLHDRARREKVRSDYRNKMLVDPIDVDPIDPLRIASDREALAIVRVGIRDLPERTRTIFILCRLEGVERQAVAEAFELSLSTVDRELARAIALLTAKLKVQR